MKLRPPRSGRIDAPILDGLSMFEYGRGDEPHPWIVGRAPRVGVAFAGLPHLEICPAGTHRR
jgi:hypothetical protein